MWANVWVSEGVGECGGECERVGGVLRECARGVWVSETGSVGECEGCVGGRECVGGSVWVCVWMSEGVCG